MAMLIQLDPNLTNREVRQLMVKMIALGVDARPAEGGREWVGMDATSPAQLDRIAQLWGVKAIRDENGLIVRVGRRRMSEFVIPTLILWMTAFTGLLWLSGWLPDGLGERPDIKSPPTALAGEWYLLFIQAFLKLIPDVVGFIGPIFLGAAFLAVALWPFIETGPEQDWRRRKGPMGLAIAAVLILILLSLYGFKSS